MYQVIAAIVTALVMIWLTVSLSKVFSPPLMAAAILCSIAFIYVGFSLKDNPPVMIALEVTAALGFYFLALVGYIKNVRLLGYGIILHGVWDILHHGSIIVTTDIAEFWPVYCLIVDLIYGVYLLMFSKEFKIAS